MFSKILDSNLISKLILILVTLLPIFYLPAKISALGYSKFILIYTFIFLVGLIFFINCLSKEKQTRKINILTLSIFLIIFSYTISTFLSKNFSISFWGRDFSTDSWITVVGLFSLTLIISSFFNKSNVLNVVWSVLITSGLVSFIQLLNVFIPSMPSMGLLYSTTNNLIGKVNDLSLYSSLGIMIGVLALEQVKLSKKFRNIIFGILAINLIIVFVINFYLSLYILLFFGLFSYFYKVFTTSKASENKSRFINVSLIIILISLIGIIFGTTLNNLFLNKLNLNYLEVRPSISATHEVNRESLKEDLVFGTGPATFEAQWPLYKPDEILVSEFWNLDFRYGHGIIMSFVSTLGVLGALAWSLFFLILTTLAIKSWFIKTKDNESKFILNTVSFVTLSLWVVAVLYIPTSVVFSLAFIFTGLFMALLVDLKIIAEKEVEINSFVRKILAIVAIVVITIGFILILFKFASHTYFQRSITAISENKDINSVLYLTEKAQSLNNIDINSRSLARVNSTILFNKISTEQELSSEDVNQSIEKIVESYEKSVKYDANNYSNYLEFGNFYSDLVAIGFSKDESYTAALNLYNKASELKPNNPFIQLSIARLEFVNRNYKTAKEKIISVIQTKPDYFDAYVALAQVQLESGDKTEAVNTIKEYLKLFPNDINAMYQLAMMYIQVENYNSAIEQFEAIYKIEGREEIKQWIEDIKVKQNSVGSEFRIEELQN
jgi:tetratricopeptide (TPR) repeat protein